MCLTALHLAQPQYAWVVVPVELEEIMEKVILECMYIMGNIASQQCVLCEFTHIATWDREKNNVYTL